MKTRTKISTSTKKKISFEKIREKEGSEYAEKYKDDIRNQEYCPCCILSDAFEAGFNAAMKATDTPIQEYERLTEE